MESSSSPEQLNWRKFLDPAHYNVPLHALRYSVCTRLGYYLDDVDVLSIHNDMVPNFGGLAELVGFDGLQIANMERAKSPTKQLLDDWKCQSDLNPTVGRLIEFLTVLGRVDILTDCMAKMYDDIHAFLNQRQRFEEMKSAPIQDETVSSGPGYEEIPRHITIQDVTHGCETYYHAFVCFNPYGDSSRDLEFVREMIRRLEGPRFNFKLFVPYRDELAGLNAHSISAKIISERCKHMIVVLSRNFLSSPACDFQSTFAHSLSPGARNKRIVPIKIQECPTPNILRIMACCDFTKRDLWDWSWERLARSIMVPLNAEDLQVSESPCMDGLIRSSTFDLNSVLESGVFCTSHSPTSSRSASPSPRQNLTAPISTSPSPRQNLTAPISTSPSPKQNLKASTATKSSGSPILFETIGMFFSSKKSKMKDKSTVSN